MSNNKVLEEFLTLDREITSLKQIVALLQWDSETYMPQSAQDNRSNQIGLLSRWIHEKIISENYSKALDNLISFEISNPNASLKRMIKLNSRSRDQAIKLPTKLVEEIARETSLAHQIWIDARKSNDFKKFVPSLSKLIELTHQKIDCIGYKEEPYDAILEEFEPDLSTKEIDLLFQKLEIEMKPVIQNGRAYSNPFINPVSVSHQESFCKYLKIKLGLNDEISRLDVSAHPFSTTIGRSDFRITTRYLENDPLSSVFGVLHESGHSMYEWGLSEMDSYPCSLTDALSYGYHESQSRLWENLVGRSPSFWKYYFPIMKQKFNIEELQFNDFIKYSNQVKPSKIRVEADPTTYNLHIILRFQLERQMFRKEIQINDLPEIWNEKMKNLLGVEVQNDSEGVLQDVHWSMGAFAYFPSYTIGNLIASQLFHKFLSDNPNFKQNLETTGDTSSLLQWLKKNLHHKGSELSFQDRLKIITGSDLDTKYFISDLINTSKEMESYV